MTLDRQTARWAAARQRNHAAIQAHRDAVRELEVAAVELAAAGQAIAERIAILARPASTAPATADPLFPPTCTAYNHKETTP